ASAAHVTDQLLVGDARDGRHAVLARHLDRLEQRQLLLRRLKAHQRRFDRARIGHLSSGGGAIHALNMRIERRRRHPWRTKPILQPAAAGRRRPKAASFLPFATMVSTTVVGPFQAFSAPCKGAGRWGSRAKPSSVSVRGADPTHPSL